MDPNDFGDLLTLLLETSSLDMWNIWKNSHLGRIAKVWAGANEKPNKPKK